MPWNARPDVGRLAPGVPKSNFWATDPGGLEQVGCVYTAQGFEFDYVGVIFGEDLVYRPGQGWIGQSSFSKDGVVRRGKSGQRSFTEHVKNTYRVLLTRGLRGCYVYLQDGPTRDFVAKRTLTNLYNARPTWLANAHATLDAAVLDAEILAHLLALNLERAAAEHAAAAPGAPGSRSADAEQDSSTPVATALRAAGPPPIGALVKKAVG